MTRTFVPKPKRSEQQRKASLRERGLWRGEAGGEWFDLANPMNELREQYGLLRRFVQEEAELVGFADQIDHLLALPASLLIAVSSDAWVERRHMPDEARQQLVGHAYLGQHVVKLIRECWGPYMSDTELRYVRRVVGRQEIPRFVN